MSNSAKIVISVIDANTAPFFDVPLGDDGNVDAGVPAGSPNGTVVATFPVDNPDNVTFTCTVSDPSRMFFAVIENGTCVVKTNGTFNPPNDVTVRINVTVSDPSGGGETVGVDVLFDTSCRQLPFLIVYQHSWRR